MITPPRDTPPGGHAPVSPGDSSGSGGEDPGRAGRRLREDARHPGDEGRTRGREELAGLRGTAADNLERLAEGAQAAASTLQHDDVGHLSEYVSDMARRMTGFSSTLRTKSGDEILRDVSRVARENPALFVTGSVAIGFGLARFARASQKKAVQETVSERASRSYGESSTHSPQSGTHDYAVTASAAVGSTGPASANPVNPTDRPGTSAGPQRGIH